VETSYLKTKMTWLECVELTAKLSWVRNVGLLCCAELSFIGEYGTSFAQRCTVPTRQYIKKHVAVHSNETANRKVEQQPKRTQSKPC